MSKHNFKEILTRLRKSREASLIANTMQEEAEEAAVQYLSLLTGRSKGNFIVTHWSPDCDYIEFRDVASGPRLKVYQSDLEKSKEEILALYEANQKEKKITREREELQKRKALYESLRREFEGER